MEHKALNALRPEFDVWTRFARYVKELAMSIDASPKTHSIVQHVVHPDEIKDKFDAISYAKGGSILRMCEAIFGEQVFKTGVQDYLREYQYRNTTTHDLFSSIQKHSDLDPHEIMYDWITKPSFPLVIVSRTSEGTIQLTQSSFYVVNAEETWLIPVQYKDAADEIQLFLFRTKQSVLPIDAGSRMPKLNYLGRGFYKVLYKGALLEEVFERYSSYEVEDRYELASDLCQLYAQRLLSLKQLVTAIRHIVHEYNYVVLCRIESFLKWLWINLDGKQAFPGFVKHLTARIMESTFEGLKSQECHGDSLRSLRLSAKLLLTICQREEVREYCDPDVEAAMDSSNLDEPYEPTSLEVEIASTLREFQSCFA